MPHICLHTPLGALTIIADDDAIVALKWGETAGGSACRLLDRARDELHDYFAGARSEFTLPLQPAGTAFLRRTWAAMSAIPYGRTVTYGQLAFGLDTGPRSVGLACRCNPLPILVPCHRVLAAAGRLGGYSGGEGLTTKRALLELEGVSLPPPQARLI